MSGSRDMAAEVVRPEVVWEVGALLGEGPAWFVDEQALRFVDIKRGRVHRYVPASGARETIETGGMPSFILPEAGGGALVGSRAGLHRLGAEGLDPALATIAMPAHNRTNDAAVDPRGRLWFGTMDDEENVASGSFYCLDEAGLHPAGGEAVVTNGPAVTRDGSLLYHVDSGERRIWRCPIGDRPALGRSELFLQLGEADGHPDGVVLDSEDCLWVALWDGWAVRRYSPEGALLLEVDFPCARVTKLAFGGPDLRTAYVTTARVGLSDEALAAQPLAGALFRFAAPVAGNPLPGVRIAK